MPYMAGQGYRTIGQMGESIVSEMLIKRGFCIEKTNFRYRTLGEIDIFASKDSVLYSIEVKTSAGFNPLVYQDKIDRKKALRVITLTEIYNERVSPVRHVNIRYYIAFVEITKWGNLPKCRCTFVPMAL